VHQEQLIAGRVSSCEDHVKPDECMLPISFTSSLPPQAGNSGYGFYRQAHYTIAFKMQSTTFSRSFPILMQFRAVSLEASWSFLTFPILMQF